MIVHPRFYRNIPCDPARERERRGLLLDVPTGLVCFGGQGSPLIRTISDALDGSGLRVQLILLCGRDEALAAKLRNRVWRIPVCVEGFTAEMPYHMRLSDFFIGKPGSGSISEALVMKLPVIVDRNPGTLPWERYNAEWILENGVGLVVINHCSIADAVERLLDTGVYAECRAKVESMANRAVFEAVDILQRILGEAPA